MAFGCGRLDDDRMMDGLTPEQFEEWAAFFAIEGDPWHRLATIMRNGLTLLANAWGAKATPEMIDPWYESPPGDDADREEVL